MDINYRGATTQEEGGKLSCFLTKGGWGADV